MNGRFFTLDADATTYKNGKYISPYSQIDIETWVLSKEPERNPNYNLTQGYGTADEFQVLFDLQSENWLPVPKKTLSATPKNYKIVDVNIIGSFVDYVVQYIITQTGNLPPTRCLYFRDRNVDGVFETTDYSIYYTGGNDNDGAKCILGAYDKEQTYIKRFNNSVMLYSNLRMVIMGNAIMSYSYAIDWSRIGVLLIPYGDLQEEYILGSYRFNAKQYIITKTGTGYIRIIRIGTEVPNRIERIAQYIHKINTVDVVNILVEREIRVTAEHGSLDWNNKFEVINGVMANEYQDFERYHVNSGYNPLYGITGLRSASMITDDISFDLYGLLYNRPVDNGYALKFFNTTLINNGSIDVFYHTLNPSIYKYSIINGIQRFNTLFENQSFPAGPIVPFPIGTKWSMHNEVKAIGEMSIGLMAIGAMEDNKTLGIYIYANQIYFGQDAFFLFGVQYVFDGDFIYQDSEQIAMAFGYNFLGCDNKSAYFYNPWDKSIYQFTGARNLIKILNLSNRTAVKIGRFDGFSGEMILLTEDEILKNREDVIMNFPYTPTGQIIPTKKGAYIEIEGDEKILLSPLDNDNEILEIITEFLGVDGSTVCDYERVDIRLYSPEKKPITFTIELQTINQDTKESEQKRIELKSNDWSRDGYKTIKLIPKYKKGTGLSLRVYSEQEIFITGIEFTYDAIARTANSQRDGF